jgi:hypothetical protein
VCVEGGAAARGRGAMRAGAGTPSTSAAPLVTDADEEALAA